MPKDINTEQQPDEPEPELNGSTKTLPNTLPGERESELSLKHVTGRKQYFVHTSEQASTSLAVDYLACSYEFGTARTTFGVLFFGATVPKELSPKLFFHLRPKKSKSKTTLLSPRQKKFNFYVFLFASCIVPSSLAS